MSRRPYAAIVRSMSAGAVDGSVRSAVRHTARRPHASTSDAVADDAAPRPCTSTTAPAEPRATAIARPSPRDAPVTSATRPPSRNRSATGGIEARADGREFGLHVDDAVLAIHLF